MRNTNYKGYLGPRMSRELMKQRVRHVLENELTEKQRRAVLDYYVARKTIPQMALEYGLNKSTVWRTLKRGEDRLHRFLRS